MPTACSPIASARPGSRSFVRHLGELRGVRILPGMKIYFAQALAGGVQALQRLVAGLLTVIAAWMLLRRGAEIATPVASMASCRKSRRLSSDVLIA